MASKEIAKYFVTLAAQGYETVKTQLAQLRDNLQGMQQNFQATADIGKRAFLSLSGAILGLTAVASPADFDAFKGALARLGVQMGVIVAPLVRELTGYIMDLVKWFRSLTDQQREQITNWVKTAVVISAVVLGIGLLGKALLLLNVNPLMLIATALGIIVAGFIKAKMEAEAFQANLKRLQEGGLNKEDLAKGNNYGNKLIKQLEGRSQENQIANAEADAARQRAEAEKLRQTADERQKKSMLPVDNSAISATISAKLTAAAVAQGIAEKLKKGESLADIKSGNPYGANMRAQSPELMSITQAWVKAQTTIQGMTPELAALQEQLETQKKGNENTARIAKTIDDIADEINAGALP